MCAPKRIARFRCKRARLSLFRPQPHLPSFMTFIQIHPSFRDLLVKTTFQIVLRYTIIILSLFNAEDAVISSSTAHQICCRITVQNLNVQLGLHFLHDSYSIQKCGQIVYLQ